MTNLEWIRTLSEEEFADWLYDEWLHHLQYRWSSSRGGLIIWLKDRKTENSSEKPNNCETCRFELYCPEMCEGCCEWDSHYEPKDEPQIDCYMCKWLGEVDVCGRCRNKNLFAEADAEPTTEDCSMVDKDINVCSKEEPQTERIKTPDYCDICNHKGCGNCIANNLDDYCVPSGYEPITQMKTQNSNLSFEKADERCKGCGHYKLTCDLFSEICKYEPKDEPQTERGE